MLAAEIKELTTALVNTQGRAGQYGSSGLSIAHSTVPQAGRLSHRAKSLRNQGANCVDVWASPVSLADTVPWCDFARDTSILSVAQTFVHLLSRRVARESQDGNSRSSTKRRRKTDYPQKAREKVLRQWTCDSGERAVQETRIDHGLLGGCF